MTAKKTTQKIITRLSASLAFMVLSACHGASNAPDATDIARDSTVAHDIEQRALDPVTPALSQQAIDQALQQVQSEAGGAEAEGSQDALEQYAIDDHHTSQNSLDWEGVYQGTLPCEDCEGIATTLTLDDDGTYQLSVQRLGRESAPTQVSGTMMWTKGGQKIQLDTAGQHRMFFVGEGRIWALDRQGQWQGDKMSDAYALFQLPSD